MQIASREHFRRVGPHRQIIDTGRHLVETVVDTGRNDDHVARPHLAPLRRLVKRRGVAWPDDDFDDLAVAAIGRGLVTVPPVTSVPEPEMM